MTDSAGTPPEPNHRADDEPPTASTASTGSDGDEAAKDGTEPKPEPEGGPEAGPDSGLADEAGDKTAAGAGDDGGEDDAAGDDEPAEGGSDEPDTSVAAAAEATADNPDGPDTPAAPDRPKRHWLRWTALGASVVVLAAAGAGWWFYQKLDGNITTDTTAEAELRAYEKERPAPVAVDAQNILLIGSDTRSGEGNSKYGRDDGGSQRSDTTILLHLAADRQSATAVSIPRDLMVEVPGCRAQDGERSKKQFAQFNWAFQFGGTACTIRTVENFSGVRIDHHMVVDFHGFKDMVDAVDGVEVCLQKPVDDDDAHLTLPAGKQTLSGEQALGYVRARKTIGDGSDTERMERQQQFLGSLVKKVQSNGVLLNPTRLYPVLDAATKSLTTDPGLDTLRDLYDLARGMRSVPTEKVQFLTVPRQPYVNDPNRDEMVQPQAGQLFRQLREDKPLSVVPGGEKKSGNGAEGNTERDANGTSTDGKQDDTRPPEASATPTFSGTNAAAGVCE